jgi:hypothetical protein
MKLSQIRRRIELCMRKIILRFWDEFINFTFFMAGLFIFVLASTEVHSYWAVETLRDLCGPLAEAILVSDNALWRIHS